MRKIIIFSFLIIANLFRSLASKYEGTYKLLFLPGFESTRWQIGKWKAWRMFSISKKRVPAYREFLKTHAAFAIPVRDLDPDLSVIPISDKESYIKPYSIEARCVDGAIPSKGVVIDESSGTSGTPNNWVRGPRERHAIKTTLQMAVHHLVGDQQYIFINAFALGPWATGMNVSMSLIDIFILKSTGPELQKIINTLNLFGPKYRYIIAGYPPFLKALSDSSEVAWQEFDITAFYGGEGMSESMRAYLSKSFNKIYGSYGASDLEINIGSENDFTIRLRQLLIGNPNLAARITRHQNTPMIFQYNPLDYYIESSDAGELIITLCRPTNISPKIRYNIHDLGHVVRIPELIAALKAENIPLTELGPIPSDLPLLLQYGRTDMAVAFYGSKITPAEIEEIIFSNKALSNLVNSFALITSEDGQANKRLCVALELREHAGAIPEHGTIAMEIFDALKVLNQDYRESSKMIPAGFEPTIEFHASGTGPFADSDIRLKKRYIQKQ